MIKMEQIISLEDMLRSYCISIHPSKDRADDAIQLMYLWLCERSKKNRDAGLPELDFLDYKGQPNHHYLRLLVRSRLIDGVRSDKRRGEREQGYAGMMLDDQGTETDEGESQHYLDAITLVEAINKEKRYNRELLKLVYFKKIKQKDLAIMLDVPYITLKKDVREARESIKRTFNASKENN